MRVRLKLNPGQRGTKHLSRQYGDRHKNMETPLQDRAQTRAKQKNCA